MRILATNFLIDGGFLGLVATDDLGNLQVLECNGVTSKLQCVADVHLGGRCVAMDRLELACTYNTPTSSSSSSAHAADDDSERLSKSRIGLIIGTLDGGVDVLAPLDEVSFRGLYALQATLIKHEDVHHNAGLNPRAFRLIQAHESLGRARQGNIADGHLLQRFLSMNYVLQRQLARMIGTSADTLVDSLMELELATRWS
jgi:cleavage and polyadenylation specificity factor subunit 1